MEVIEKFYEALHTILFYPLAYSPNSDYWGTGNEVPPFFKNYVRKLNGPIIVDQDYMNEGVLNAFRESIDRVIYPDLNWADYYGPNRDPEKKNYTATFSSDDKGFKCDFPYVT